MRCYNCGSEFSDDMSFCQRCGSPLRGPKPGDPYGTTQLQATGRHTEFWPLFTPFLGIIIAVVGVLLYALSVSSVFDEVTDPDYDPWNTNDIEPSIDMIVVSFGIITFGGLVFFIGLIWLVLRSD